MYLALHIRETSIRRTVKSRCYDHRYSDYLGVAIGLACTNLVHTNFNDYPAVTIIVRIPGDFLLVHRYNGSRGCLISAEFVYCMPDFPS